jgi:hypothetical protein
MSSITIQPEVMHLIRQLLVTWLPHSEPIRAVITSLPHITPQVRDHSLEEVLQWAWHNFHDRSQPDIHPYALSI